MRYDVAARDLGGLPLEARVRGTNRRIDRTGVRGVILSTKDTRDRLYEASLAFAPMKGRFSATAGRLGAHPFVSLGYLDGVLAEVRPTSNIQLGGVRRQHGGDGRPRRREQGRRIRPLRAPRQPACTTRSSCPACARTRRAT